MIIGTKGLDEQPVLCAAELKELFVGGDNLAKAGHPPMVPAAIPTGQLLRIIATCKAYHDLVSDLAHLEDGLEQPKLIESFDSFQERANELIKTPPPSPVAEPPKSRIVMPGG